MKSKALVYVIAAIGGGLVLAPVVFQMFTRAPLGGQMISEFRPYMQPEVISRFNEYLDDIASVEAETSDARRSGLLSQVGLDDQGFTSLFPQLSSFERQWPAIESEMRSLLNDIGANLDNFEAVDSLPPFPLFPWFFIAPGVIIEAAAIHWLRGGSPLVRRLVLAVGLGLIAAPAIFQMFSRAPLGAQMIDDLRPLMTSEKVTAVQLHFLAIGGAETELRRGLKPLIRERLGLSEETFAKQFPATARLIAEWPEMAAQMAPMVGTMSDNRDNFEAVDALPTFNLFPWFFVAPGVLLVGLAIAAGRVPNPNPARAVALSLLVIFVSASCSDGEKTASGGNSDLVGVFKIDGGECAGGSVTKGSYFRMVQPGGAPGEGPFVVNGDSQCGDKTFTPLSAGSDGGLLTGAFQPNPEPAFDSGGNALASSLAQPQKWFAVAFALSTNPKDPQTGTEVAAPKLKAAGAKLGGDLRAFSATWNGQFFNQGSPKPDGSTPGNTTLPRGSYDATANTYSIEWDSQIVGGAFDNFTGSWHLEGEFQAK